jgi:DivIVA domain-containing protein
MTLTPDEIAKRGFTPSADGYHQGEVREFLARIAAQQRAMAASLPEGGPQVTELMLAVSNHESRLHQLEARLHNALEQLEEATRSLQTTQDRASQQLATARKVTNDQRTMLEQLTPAATAPPNSAPVAPASSKPAAPAAQPEPARIAPAATVPSSTARLTKPPVDRRPDRPTMAPPTPVSTTPPAPTPPRTSTPDAPGRAAAHLATPEPAPKPLPSPEAVLADFDRKPLIADNANDLLDGVLDDVMGTITERPDA